MPATRVERFRWQAPAERIIDCRSVGVCTGERSVIDRFRGGGAVNAQPPQRDMLRVTG